MGGKNSTELAPTFEDQFPMRTARFLVVTKERSGLIVWSINSKEQEQATTALVKALKDHKKFKSVKGNRIRTKDSKMEGTGTCLCCDTLSLLGWHLTALSTAGTDAKPLPTFTFTKPAESYQMICPMHHMVIYANKKQTFLVNCGWAQQKREAVGLISGGLKAVNMYHSTNIAKQSSVRYLTPKMGEHLLPLALCSALQTIGWKLCCQNTNEKKRFMMIFALPAGEPQRMRKAGAAPESGALYPAPPAYAELGPPAAGSLRLEPQPASAPVYEDSEDEFDEQFPPSAPEGEGALLSVDDFLSNEGEQKSQPEGEGHVSR